MKEIVDRLIRVALEREQRDGLFALVDAARDPQLYDALVQPDVEASCLYTEELPEELARAAPYVVDLDRSPDFTDRFHQAWGKSWGVLARAPVDLETLRRHFKSLNVVRGPDGQKLLFRYYDPRVLRVYLPTCTPDELRRVLGPVREIVTEGADCTAIRFTFDGRTLSSVRHGHEGADTLRSETRP